MQWWLSCGYVVWINVFDWKPWLRINQRHLFLTANAHWNMEVLSSLLMLTSWCLRSYAYREFLCTVVASIWPYQFSNVRKSSWHLAKSSVTLAWGNIKLVCLQALAAAWVWLWLWALPQYTNWCNTDLQIQMQTQLLLVRLHIAGYGPPLLHRWLFSISIAEVNNVVGYL